MSVPALTRRSLLTGSVVAVVGAVAGFAVAKQSSIASTKASTTGANGYGPAPSGAGGGADNGNGGVQGHVLTSLSNVTGSGIVVDRVVLTRSSDGGVHGVSAICTHQGCTVGAPHNGVVSCPCHGSQFEAATGKVLHGPATQPLPPVRVAVHGQDVVQL